MEHQKKAEAHIPQEKIERRIGHTTYEVHIRFQRYGKETINDKISRLIKNQIADSHI